MKILTVFKTMEKRLMVNIKLFTYFSTTLNNTSSKHVSDIQEVQNRPTIGIPISTNNDVITAIRKHLYHNRYCLYTKLYNQS